MDKELDDQNKTPEELERRRRFREAMDECNKRYGRMFKRLAGGADDIPNLSGQPKEQDTT